MRRLEHIKPRVDNESDRMSWNLYKFAKRHGVNKIKVFATDKNTREPMNILISIKQTPYSYLGHEKNRVGTLLLGKRLMTIFCSYGRETTACHDYELSEFPVDITEKFFNDYIQSGRCFYLRGMSHKFNIGDELQEDGSSKKVRVCEYCGKKEYSHTWEEVVIRERWE